MRAEYGVVVTCVRVVAAAVVWLLLMFCHCIGFDLWLFLLSPLLSLFLSSSNFKTKHIKPNTQNNLIFDLLLFDCFGINSPIKCFRCECVNKFAVIWNEKRVRERKKNHEKWCNCVCVCLSVSQKAEKYMLRTPPPATDTHSIERARTEY